MRHLLLSLLLLGPLAVSAQTEWSFSGDFPDNTDRQFGSTHGLAVDGEGRIWVQPFSSSADSVVVDDTTRTSGTVLVFDADGSEADCSPIRFLSNADGVVTDTLGIAVNAAGAIETQTGRGLRADKDGDVLITQGNLLFKVDHESCGDGDDDDGDSDDNTVVLLAKAQPLTGSMTAAGTDEDGNFYITQVVGPAPLLQLGPNLTELATVGTTRTFNRSVLATPDGQAVWDFSYTTGQPVVFYKADEFADYDSLGVTPRGMKIESSAVQPQTGWLWFSAGSTADQPNQDPAVVTNWRKDTWYGFAQEDLFTFDASGNVTGVVEVPTPRDSITWNGDTEGRARGLAFSADGMTAYVGQFSKPAPATQQFIRMPVSTEDGPRMAWVALDQNAPNPTTGRTDISFSMERAGHARLVVFDVTGREVARLVDRPMGAGEHSATLDAGQFAPGVYLYTLQVDDQRATRRMVVVR